MKIHDLLTSWQETANAPLAAREFTVHLPLHDAARILALAEMYPGRTTTQIITELLSVALDEVEEALPYVQGNKVVAEDDYGDPIYEDIGATPRFVQLTHRYRQILEQEGESGGSSG